MITLPVMVLLFVTLSLGLSAGLGQHRIQQTAHDHARVLSYGGDPSALPVHEDDALTAVTTSGDTVCVTYQHVVDRGVWRVAPMTLLASACALAPPPADG